MCVIGLEFIFSSYSEDGLAQNAIISVDPRRGVVDRVVDSFSSNIGTGNSFCVFLRQHCIGAGSPLPSLLQQYRIISANNLAIPDKRGCKNFGTNPHACQ